jgi:hypothetical protein
MENFYLANTNDQGTTNGVPAELVAVNVTTGVATAVVTVYNGTSTSAAVVATIDAAVANCFQFEGIHLSAGLFVKMTTAAAKVTVTYQ